MPVTAHVVTYYMLERLMSEQLLGIPSCLEREKDESAFHGSYSVEGCPATDYMAWEFPWPGCLLSLQYPGCLSFAHEVLLTLIKCLWLHVAVRVHGACTLRSVGHVILVQFGLD